MNGNQQSALAALRSVEPIVSRLDRSREPEDRAADILELWQGTETALRALIGGSSLGGQGLIRELRQREVISLGQAYALLEFLGARDRANRTTYKTTDNDVVVAREGYRQLESGLVAAVAADAAAAPAFPPDGAPSTAAPPMGAPPMAPTPPVSVPPMAAAAAAAGAAAPDYSRPTTPAGPSVSAGAGGSAMGSAPGWSSPPPPPAAYGPPAYNTPPATAEPLPPGPTYAGSRLPTNFWFLVSVLVLAAALIGGYMVFARRSDPDKRLNEAVAAMQSGRREAARTTFSEIARDNPELATPHVFLSRLSREEGDLGTARRELETAIRLEPKNAIALREMGLILFSAGNYELSRRFFVRALTENPDDKASQGYLGCALARLNRFDEAQRFISRAGPGSWSSCLPNRPL
ncbi:MAG TPA: tetratricopeptide repeat protein [Gemmatimonadaceae bacterium]|nr:tetratricopeptide repeat protein [Gemmatimonadaceae bacterium]